MGNEGLTLTLEKDGSAIPDGNSDGTWEYTSDSVGSYDGEDLAFVLKREICCVKVSLSLRTANEEISIETIGIIIIDIN